MAQSDIPTTANPAAARDLARQFIASHGFTVASTGEYSSTVERGSKAGTIWLGAFVGKKNQHVRYDLAVFQGEGGGAVVRLVSTTSGAAAGVIGMSRANDLFAEWSNALSAALPH